MKMVFNVLVVVSIVLNILLISFLYGSGNEDSVSKTKKESEFLFPFLSRRIFVENQNDLLINFIPLRTELQKYVSDLPNKTGVYFEYLPTGTSIGVNDKESFFPASLLKTPLAMEVYKNYENKTLSPNTLLSLTDEDKDFGFGDLWKEKAGTQYRVSKLMDLLLIYSDNTAQNIHLRHLNGNEVSQVFDELDIPKTRDEYKQPVVTPKNYTSILRCLYLSCHLSKENSNELLRKLTRTIFKDKLPAGVPEGINVAHKIGVAGNPDDNLSAYSDCGIIYLPQRPYALCIMTQANNETATKIISEISKITYDFISKVK